MNHSRLCKLSAKRKKNEAIVDKAHFPAGLENVSAEPTRLQQLKESVNTSAESRLCEHGGSKTPKVWPTNPNVTDMGRVREQTPPEMKSSERRFSAHTLRIYLGKHPGNVSGGVSHYGDIHSASRPARHAGRAFRPASSAQRVLRRHRSIRAGEMCRSNGYDGQAEYTPCLLLNYACCSLPVPMIVDCENSGLI